MFIFGIFQAEIAISAQTHIRPQIVCTNVLVILLLGLEKSTKPSSFPLIILLKMLIFKNCLYIYMYLKQCVSVAVSTINDQLRHIHDECLPKFGPRHGKILFFKCPARQEERNYSIIIY